MFFSACLFRPNVPFGCRGSTDPPLSRLSDEASCCMSYLVLARKWRPQTFADLVGQEHVGRTLSNAIACGRVHHAFLFTGARGVGKTSAARILAKALNCVDGPAAEPCNQCDICRDITTGNAVDVLEIDGASNNGVDNVRELRETLRYLPARCRYRIIIIDEVHMLSGSAFNALLKTLEEPPDHVKFIFATTEPHKIPITILSRCQRFDFRKIAAAKVAAQLRRIVDAEGIHISDRALALVTQRGEGSMRDSLSTLDQVVAFCGEQVEDADVTSLLGLVDRRLLFDTLEGCIGHQPALVLETIRRVDEAGYALRPYCQQLVELCRQLILCPLVDDPARTLQLTADELAELRTLAAGGAQEDWQRLLDLLLHCQNQLGHSSFPRVQLEMTLVRAATLPPARDVASLLQALERLQLQGATAAPVVTVPRQKSPAPVAATTAAAPVADSPPVPAAARSEAAEAVAGPAAVSAAVEQDVAVSVDEAVSVAGDWSAFVAFVQQKRPRIGAILAQVSALVDGPPVLQLVASAGSFVLQQLRDGETQEALQELGLAFYGQRIQVKVEAASGDVVLPPSLQEARRQEETDRERRLRQDALGHPLVQKAVEIFSGQVLAVKATDKGFV